MTASPARAPAARPAPRCPAVGRWSAPTAPRGREVRLRVGGHRGCGQRRHGWMLPTFLPSPGKRCELCDDGFFGDPLGQRGPVHPCEPCQCHGNVDLNAVGNCDPVSGRCLRCLYNTMGDRCERCRPGFYGDALAPSPAGKCARTYSPRGQLTCSQNPPSSEGRGWKGMPSRFRDDGWFRLSPSVPECSLLSCSTAILPQRYSGLQGLFLLEPCLTGERGSPRCQELSLSAPFLQPYPPAPCRDLRAVLSPIACDCNPNGSDPRLEGCDPGTGQCHCLPHVTGRACGQCQPGYYGLEPAVGCKRYVGHGMGLPGDSSGSMFPALLSALIACL